MKRIVVIASGVLLVALAVAWFASDLPRLVQQALQDAGLVAAGQRAGGAAGPWETIKLGLDIANAVIGCVGIYLTLNARGQSQKISS